jgi:hypothetical protein
MIDNVDRMSVKILPFSLDRALSFVWRISLWTKIFNLYQINQDQNLICKPLTEEPSFVVSLRTDQPGFFSVNIFQSKIR